MDNAKPSVLDLRDAQRQLADAQFARSIAKREATEGLASALQATWERDPNLYYEDGFQEMVNRGAHIGTAPIGDLPWIEVDTLEDLARAREIVCHY